MNWEGGGDAYCDAMTMCPRTSDFDAQMSGIKFWKDDENLGLNLNPSFAQKTDISGT